MAVDDLVRRQSRGTSEARRDREMLAWIARFRFVTAEVLGERFDVTPQRVNARLRRFEHAGLVALHRSDLTAPRAVFLTGRGARRLGQRPRRAPRPDTHREHELAIATLTAQLEKTGDALHVLTERDAREVEARGGVRCSADVRDASGVVQHRWPDLLLETPAGARIAVELEFAPKHTGRLRRILTGYAAASWFTELRVLVRDEPVRRRIAGLVDAASPSSELTELLGLRAPNVIVSPWKSPEAASEALHTAVAPA